MPNGSGAAHSSKIPPDVAPNLRRFESLIRPALEHVSVVRREAASGAIVSGAEAPGASEALDLLLRFGLLVHAQAESQALVSKSDRPYLFTRHLLDSLNPMSLFDVSPRHSLDIGSGGGFPGIPLAIVWPGARFTLLESRERKAGFLERAVRELGLRNVSVVCERLERVGRYWHIDPVDAVFVRAVGGLDDLLRQMEPVAATSCRWVYFLGAERDAVSIQESLDARGLDSEVTEGLFGGRLLTGILRGRA